MMYDHCMVCVLVAWENMKLGGYGDQCMGAAG